MHRKDSRPSILCVLIQLLDYIRSGMDLIRDLGGIWVSHILSETVMLRLAHELGAVWECVGWFCSKMGTLSSSYLRWNTLRIQSKCMHQKAQGRLAKFNKKKLVNVCMQIPFGHTLRNFTWPVTTKPEIAFSKKDEKCVVEDNADCSLWHKLYCFIDIFRGPDYLHYF